MYFKKEKMKAYVIIEIAGDMEIDYFKISGVYLDPDKANLAKSEKEAAFQKLLDTPEPIITEGSTDEEFKHFEEISNAHFMGKLNVRIEEHEIH
jgi:rRNA maturation protein Rpf1